MSILVEIGLVVLEKKMKMRKVNNDDGKRTNCDQKGSLEPSAQVSLKWNPLDPMVLFIKFD